MPNVYITEAQPGNINKREVNETEYSFVADYATGSSFTIQYALTADTGTLA